MMDLAKMHEELIEEGAHAIVIKDALLCTMQPLTKHGVDGMRRMLKAFDAPIHFIEGVDRKRNGLYVAAVPVQNTDPEAVARQLTDWISGNVCVFRTEDELPANPLLADA